ncbi:FAD-dependent thymidylate synthase [Corynebacterium urealyticum]|uniref:FAD-dependent thymidylate synthase n=1 Tax=Corynebacterium urealyticum TaxID=43771 RepID=UPI00293EED7A|nr:FAD-dependent thymidylate synthase [Corynebacterium urealyticum]WOH94961.1 FAD-dependent thymidylate synthase [Corynebacterium urealyticum]
MYSFADPRVELIAHTTLACNGRSPAIEKHMSLDPDAGDMQQLVEFAGRACYQSFHKPNPKTARNKDYIARTLHEQKHWSIAEHATATFYITGVSRALTHELVRHRHLSYSQLSQRFVDESEANIVIPPAADKSQAEVVYETEEFWDDLTGKLSVAMWHWWMDASLNYETVVNALTGEGLPRKQAREAARAVLPNMIETRIVVTGNLRAWHEVIERRTAPDADAEFQQVAGMIRDELKKIAPAIFTD